MSVRCACREKTGTDPARSTPAALESPALAQAVRGGDRKEKAPGRTKRRRTASGNTQRASTIVTKCDPAEQQRKGTFLT